MKILYIYLTDIRKTWSNIVQTLQMCEALSKLHEVNFFHPFLLERTLDKRLSYFNIVNGFHINRLFALGPLESKYLDFANRIIFFFQVLFYSHFSRYDLIYTRDFSFLVFLSKIPRFLRPKKRIVYEPHKVYYYASDKVNKLKLEIEFKEILPLAEQRKITIIARVPLAKGLLTDERSHLAGDLSTRDKEQLRTKEIKAHAFDFLAYDGVRTLAQSAIRFVLQYPQVSAVIPGVRKIKHLEENVATLGTPPLTQEELEKIASLSRSK